MKKKVANPNWRILAILPVIIVGCFIYNALYPSSQFYKNEFKEIAGIDLPKNANIQYKRAGYPDLHGDYTSVAIITIGIDFYKELEQHLMENGLSENNKRIGCVEMNNAKRKMKGLKIHREFSKELEGNFYYVAFLSDKQTILVQRSSN